MVAKRFIKTKFENFRDNASNEQKMTVALIASVSFTILILFLWLQSGFGLNTNKNVKKSIEKQKQKQEASALESLKKTFFEISNNSDRQDLEKELRERSEDGKIIRKPQKIEI